MKRFFILFFVAICSVAFSQQIEKYSRAKIHLDSKEKSIKNLASLGIAVDHGERKKNTFIVSDFSEGEINLAREKGYKVDVIINDVAAYYANQNKGGESGWGEQLKNMENRSIDCNSSASSSSIPSHFDYGSMGGYYTYAEMLEILDSMSAQYPNLITVKQQIDTFTSVEGRPIYWLKISDNPTVDENEPEIIYTALHHAREPESLTQLIYYMYYLLEHYGSDQEITGLIDNTEMYFVPCVNPDGYVYNQTTAPNGGGMWRKNRRNNNNSTHGIDLNRNYGYNWGYDDVGSSPSTNDETYRGPSAFSEPETRAIKWLDEHHQFKISINYHTYGNDLIYPWGYIASLHTPDSAVYENITKLMTSKNHYIAGTGDQTVGYVTNGDSDDWGYGEQGTKPKILSMTPEVGSQAGGFWPSMSDIIPMCEDALSQNIYGAELIGKYARARDEMPAYINQLSGNLDYSIQRLGLDSPAVYTVSIIPADSWITSVGNPKTYSAMSMLEILNDSISYTLSPSIAAGQVFKYVLRVNNGLYDKNDTITKLFGQTTIAYNDNGSSISGYTSGGGNWGVSSTYYVSAPSSITDSPNGNYANGTSKTIKMNTPIDLSTAVSASLNFWARWDIETGYDYVEVQASNDNGGSWTPLCGKYTKPGNANQDSGLPLYDGHQDAWVAEEMSLDDYLGATIFIRFKLVSDDAVNYDGFYFDDLTVVTLTSTTGVEEKKLQNQNVVLQNVPNPAGSATTISFALTNISNPKLVVYDVLGKKYYEENLTSGQTAVSLDLSGFANGTYFYAINGDSYSSKVLKLVVLK